MKKENRGAERFDEMGRVECTELCTMPGVLDDISLTGCKVHFPVPVQPDLEEEYELFLKWTSKDGPVSLELIGKPQWIKEVESKSYIGFRILRSPDTPELQKWIEKLSERINPDDDVKELLIDSSVQFI